MAAARVGRFYLDGWTWALSLTLPELRRLIDLMGEIMRRENVR